MLIDIIMPFIACILLRVEQQQIIVFSNLNHVQGTNKPKKVNKHQKPILCCIFKVETTTITTNIIIIGHYYMTIHKFCRHLVHTFKQAWTIMYQDLHTLVVTVLTLHEDCFQFLYQCADETLVY